MKLILSQCPDDRAPQLDPAVKIVNRTSLTIGRGPENGWALPDQDRDLSKLHCIINYANGLYSVTDHSTNGVFLNGSADRIHRGSTVMIEDGDTIRLGPYSFSVRIAPLDAQAPAPLAAPRVNPAQPAADFFSPVPVSNLPDPFGGVDPFGVPGVTGAAFPLPPPGDEFSRQAADMLDDFDLDDFVRPQPADRPLPGLSQQSSPAFGAQPAFGAPPAFGVQPAFGISAETGYAGGGDELGMFGDQSRTPDWAGAPQSDHVPSTSQFFAPPKVTTPIIPDDWDFMEDEPAASAPAPNPNPPLPISMSQPLPQPRPLPPVVEPKAAFDPFATANAGARPSPSPLPAPAVGARPPQSPDPADLLAAFLAGAGLSADAVGTADPRAVMNTVGQSYRQMVEGLREILMARSMVKSEFRMTQTVIAARNNNPLKFSFDADAAIKALLQPPRPGYLSAEQAVAEGFKDIQAHNIAVMAGMQVALKLLLSKFKPEDLAQNLEKTSMLSSILPSGRKARYWEAFVAAYAKIAREAEDDFLGVFGKEFARAYEEQVGNL